jgi:hypothetical protein
MIWEAVRQWVCLECKSPYGRCQAGFGVGAFLVLVGQYVAVGARTGVQ